VHLRHIVSLLIALAFTAVALILVTLLVNEFSYRVKAVEDGYLELDVVNTVIAYMETHEGRWPKSWDSLEPQFRKEWGFGGEADESMELCKRRFYVDFSVDSEALQTLSKNNERPTFKVIYAKFTSAKPPTGDPNLILYRYFNKRKVPSSEERDGGTPAR
jgi:hypothetical protein